MLTFNVISEPLAITILLKRFSDIKICDHFDVGDFNLRVPVETVNDFIDYCDEHNIKHTLI
jgi:hypothetical protein